METTNKFYPNYDNAHCLYNPHILCTCTQEENFAIACEHCAWNPSEEARRAKDIDGGKNLHKNAKGLLQYTVPTYTKTDNTEEE